MFTRGNSQVGLQFGVDVLQGPGQRTHVALHRETQAHGVAWGGVGVLTDDEHSNIRHGTGESAQNAIPVRQEPSSGSCLGSQEVPHLMDAWLHLRQCLCPVGGGQFGKRTSYHGDLQMDTYG